jgi:hypothetical protein
MRISSAFSSTWAAPVLLALTWGVCAGQTRSFSGSWHLNVEKSRWGSASKPFSVVIVIDHREPRIQYHGDVTYANEDERTFGFSGAFDGKPYRMSRSFGDGMITLRRLDESTVDSTFRTDDGLYTETARTSISRDGKTLTRKLTMRAPDGNTSWTEVYDKR